MLTVIVVLFEVQVSIELSLVIIIQMNSLTSNNIATNLPVVPSHTPGHLFNNTLKVVKVPKQVIPALFNIVCYCQIERVSVLPGKPHLCTNLIVVLLSLCA